MKALPLICLMSLSCATIVDRGPEHLQITSTPTGATISQIGTGDLGRTPTMIPIERSLSAVVLRIYLPGHESQEVSVPTRFNWWYAGNLVFPGVVGLVIDAATGNMYHHEDEPIHVSLKPLAGFKPAVPVSSITGTGSRPAGWISTGIGGQEGSWNVGTAESGRRQ